MTEQEIKDKEAATLAATKAAEDKAKADAEAALHADPVKEALDKENARKRRTPKEKAAYSLKKNAEKLRELGGDPADVLGEVDEEEIEDDSELDLDDADDDAPLTVGQFKKMDAARKTRTAISLADEQIEDESERALAKTYLSTRIKPSGDPQKDLEDAMALVSSVKNRKVAEEQNRRSGTAIRRTVSSSGAPARRDEAFVAEPEELTAARLAHVSQDRQKDWILTMRKAALAGNDKVIKFGSARARKMADEAKNHA